MSTATNVVMQYIDGNGTVQTQLLSPSLVNVAGTEATLVVPNQFNGAFAVHVVGSAFAPVLQIVPVLSGVTVVGFDSVRLRGKGFVEGNDSVYKLGSGSVTDSAISNNPIDVYGGFVHDNDAVNVSNLPAGGSGVASVKTAGGTSAAIAWNLINPELVTAFGPDGLALF